jgi:hypothetical protein
MPRKTALRWTTKTPTRKGFYWYRHDDGRDPLVLHVLDPMRNGVMKAWDWDYGQLMLCTIAAYEGEWYGPIEPPL